MVQDSRASYSLLKESSILLLNHLNRSFTSELMSKLFHEQLFCFLGFVPKLGVAHIRKNKRTVTGKQMKSRNNLATETEMSQD
jgi:hypothetical protein